MKIEIGMKFIKRSDKQKHIRTVIDCHKTYNLAGELVKTRYVAEHDFLGQSIKEYDLVQPTIAMGLIKDEQISCEYCNNTGKIEMDNNGPIYDCPICKG